MAEIKMMTVYPVVCGGNIVKTFLNLYAAKKYAEKMNDKGAAEIAKADGRDEVTDADYFQNGYNGGFYDVGKCEIPANETDDEDYEKNFGDDILVDFGTSDADFNLCDIHDTLVTIKRG